MSMLSCLKGRVCLFHGLLLLGFVGCSSVFRSEELYSLRSAASHPQRDDLLRCNAVKTNQSEIPISNTQVAEKVIELALESAGVPYGQGTEVSYKMDGDNEEDNLLGIIALEFLLKHGYRVVENKNSLVASCYANSEARRVQRSKNEIPEIMFSLDTLYVNLYIKRTKEMGKLTRCAATRRVIRHSEAHIGAVILSLSGIKKVYKGCGVFEDTFPFQMLESVIDGESFTTIFPAQDRIKKNVQPFLLGITMTTLVWLLYSYRG